MGDYPQSFAGCLSNLLFGQSEEVASCQEAEPQPVFDRRTLPAAADGDIQLPRDGNEERFYSILQQVSRRE
jgi:hypothetical protein